MPARSPSTKDYLPGGTCEIAVHRTQRYSAAPTAEDRECCGSIFLKKGGCSLFPHTGYRGRWDGKGLGHSSHNPFLCSPPRILKCRLGKGGKSGDSGSLRVKSQLCHSEPRVDKRQGSGTGLVLFNVGIHPPPWKFFLCL